MICRWLTSLLIVASLAYSLAEDVPSSCPSWSAEFNPVNNIQIGGSAGACNSTAIDELLTLTRTILELLQNQEPCCTPSPTPGACASNPCQNGGTCTPTNEGLDYQCTCSAGYTGGTCASDIDECASNPCQNGGTCTNKINGYQCDCPVGYTGADCAQNINECASNPCQNGATCIDETNGYRCECSPGFSGTECASNIDECASNPCQNGGTCTDEINGYRCKCLTGYIGINCAFNTDNCASNPCQNGGTCSDKILGYRCVCSTGYTGPNCATDIDECASNPCQNGGTCKDEVNGYSCECSPGSIGTHCSVVLQDCADILAAGTDVSGVYYITPDGVDGPFHVYCDMETDGGGWTVFQRREDGSIDFLLEWDDYKHGFGDVSSEHWLGNDNIHHLSTQKTYELRIDLEDFEGETRFAVYRGFSIGDEAAKYVLTVSSYSGNAGDSLMYLHSGHPFSTKDRDNDSSDINCASWYTGAWWYVMCHQSNLNGLYQNNENSKGVNWYHWHGYTYSLKKTEMKIRPL